MGSAQQNTQLLNLLRGAGTAPAQKILPQSQALAPKQAPTNITINSSPNAASNTAPVQTQTPQQTTSGSGDFGAWLRSRGYNNETVIANAVANPATAGSAYQDFLRESGGGSSAQSGVSGINQAQPVAPQLQKISDTVINEATTRIQPEIDAINSQIAAKTDAYNAQVSKIKDNPYLSEATMTGRLSKLAERFNADMQLETKKQAIAEGKLATAKADAQVKLNIAAQQYNVESSENQQNLSMFNNLLSSGALENASGADIAQITSSTGLSSSMVQSIIDFQKKKNAPKLDLQTIDDGTNQYVVAVDSTGNVVNKQVIGASKPKAAKAATADQKLAAGNFTNTQKSKAIKILAEADVMLEGQTPDKLLSANEQQQALLKIQSEIVADPVLAQQLFTEAWNSGGFDNWS